MERGREEEEEESALGGELEAADGARAEAHLVLRERACIAQGIAF